MKIDLSKKFVCVIKINLTNKKPSEKIPWKHYPEFLRNLSRILISNFKKFQNLSRIFFNFHILPKNSSWNSQLEKFEIFFKKISRKFQLKILRQKYGNLAGNFKKNIEIKKKNSRKLQKLRNFLQEYGNFRNFYSNLILKFYSNSQKIPQNIKI